ncbi:hypothetical protein V2J09_018548 [Rumex salicifolius]
MDMRRMLQRSCCFAGIILLIVLCSEPRFAESYTNYTVGDSLGWYDNLIKPNVDYQKWASAKTFSLVFNTDNNHSVVQTYNLSSYKSCDFTGEDSTEWSSSDPSSTAVYPVTVPVPLLKEGPTYFFSGDYDGWQCQHGSNFQISVLHGKGLPPSLKSDTGSSSMAPSPAEADSGDDDSVPDTVLPGANFNHPKNITGGDSGGGEADDSANAKASGSDSVLVGRFLLSCCFLVLLIV